MGQSQTTIKSSALLSLPQLGQAARRVTYQMLTEEVGLPDAV